MICIAVLPRGGLSETQNLVFDLFVSDQLVPPVTVPLSGP